MTTEDNTASAAKPTRARRAKMSAAASSPPVAPASASKSDTVIKLLLRAKGATPLELIAATDWQPHSVRAFLSGLRKKGRVIVREARKSGEFAYRIVAEPSGAAQKAAAEVGATASITSSEA
jgi:hypothetical protein